MVHILSFKIFFEAFELNKTNCAFQGNVIKTLLESILKEKQLISYQDKAKKTYKAVN